MSKHTNDPRELQQKDTQQAQQQATENRQRAEQEEVAGHHKNDGITDRNQRQGSDKGPRGQ